mmetsp:Transcript_869/g.2342  ORF Transcript_869/g.2342 Transcript_869/m.2342 type:complete len:131 (-) Transcript_869:438-830(-)
MGETTDPAKEAGVPDWLLSRRTAWVALALVGGTSITFSLWLMVEYPVTRPVGYVTGFVFLFMWASVMFFKVKENYDNAKTLREHAAFTLALEEHSYKCIQPQILGSWVTIPITVGMRGVPASQVLLTLKS